MSMLSNEYVFNHTWALANNISGKESQEVYLNNSNIETPNTQITQENETQPESLELKPRDQTHMHNIQAFNDQTSGESIFFVIERIRNGHCIAKEAVMPTWTAKKKGNSHISIGKVSSTSCQNKH